MMAAFMLDAILVHTVFDQNSGLTPRVIVYIAISYHGQPIRYKLRLISIATSTSVKCYSLKSFPSFKVSLKLFFSSIMHAHLLKRVFDTSVQPNTRNFFLDLLIRRICRAYWPCVGLGWSASHSLSVSYSFKRLTFAAHASNMDLSSTIRHSKLV
ncbi:uncharacterized protein TNCV_5005791 [Trichonephila clavipes]|nr:uncharacterized protein TNCV_5005791 [Trichonephila clavipes]